MTAIVLTNRRAFTSYAIRARLWQRWSHAILTESPDLSVDSTFISGGVRVCDLGDRLSHAADFLVVPLALPRPREASAWLSWQIGKPYDWRACFGFLTGSRDWRDDTAWFCFELIAGYIEAGSDYRFPDLARVTARDLIEAARWLEEQARKAQGAAPVASSVAL